MILWTIQPVKIMDLFVFDNDEYVCDSWQSENFDDFKNAYLWMVNEMDKRNIPHPEGVSLPLWAWYTRNGKHKKPDLRNSDYGTRGTKAVCIEFEIPDDEVLLSDFDAWHYVLNNTWFDNSRNESEWEILHEWYDLLDSETREKVKVESWQKIFDVSPEKTKWFSKGEFIQATFWELRKDMIRDVRYFTIR